MVSTSESPPKREPHFVRREHWYQRRMKYLNWVQHQHRKALSRFSIRTFMFAMLLLGAVMTVAWNWRPWIRERTLAVALPKGVNVVCASLSADRTKLLMGCDDGIGRNVDVTTGKVITELK